LYGRTRLSSRILEKIISRINITMGCDLLVYIVTMKASFWENWDRKMWYNNCVILLCPSFLKIGTKRARDASMTVSCQVYLRRPRILNMKGKSYRCL